MQDRTRSGREWVALTLVLAGALLCFMLLVRPAATDVLGQTAPDPARINSVPAAPGAQVTTPAATVSNETGQPITVQTQGNQVRISAPSDTPIQASGGDCQSGGSDVICTVGSNARLVISPGGPAPASSGAAAPVSSAPGSAAASPAGAEAPTAAVQGGASPAPNAAVPAPAPAAPTPAAGTGAGAAGAGTAGGGSGSLPTPGATIPSPKAAPNATGAGTPDTAPATEPLGDDDSGRGPLLAGLAVALVAAGGLGLWLARRRRAGGGPAN